VLTNIHTHTHNLQKEPIGDQKLYYVFPLLFEPSQEDDKDDHHHLIPNGGLVVMNTHTANNKQLCLQWKTITACLLRMLMILAKSRAFLSFVEQHGILLEVDRFF
jgi:hypothetical protein